jgi:hypothetical protein
MKQFFKLVSITLVFLLSSCNSDIKPDEGSKYLIGTWLVDDFYRITLDDQIDRSLPATVNIMVINKDGTIVLDDETYSWRYTDSCLVIRSVEESVKWTIESIDAKNMTMYQDGPISRWKRTYYVFRKN